jgi:hypothetical protein
LLSVACYLNPENHPCATSVEKLLPCGHTISVICSANTLLPDCTKEVYKN